MTVVLVGRAGTWSQFTSSWLLDLKGCFVTAAVIDADVIKANELANISVSEQFH